MKTMFSNLFHGRNSALNLALIALFFGAFILACGGGGDSSTTEKKPVPAAYQGQWTSTDGSTMSIRNDSTGDWKSGGKEVSGAAVTVDEAAKEIKFTLLGFDSGKFKIDSAPSGGKMKLDGMEYKRAGGGGTDSTSSTSGGGDIPTDAELNALTMGTMTDFNTAVQSADFADFYASTSDVWQQQTTADALQTAFQPFIDKKVDFAPKAGAKPTYAPKPSLDANKSLKVSGDYATAGGKKANFDLTYVKEGGDWKLLGIKAKQ